MRGNRGGMMLVRLWTACLLLLGTTAAMAGGPRWVGGPPFFWPPGYAISWYTAQPKYFTDPGDLSASVKHADADAMVARAAAVWNVPTSSLVLSQGGSLNEHVTGAAITMAGGTVQMPADVQSANWQQKQIAVIYDTDGSVIDALLGAGGSDPAGCLQTGVVESVDSFASNSTIQHAMLILNGRCTGPAPEQQLQMQYQLMRAFGRVLGLGWSQANDNVFTKATVPTYQQALNWPVMHPIDINCGTYTYQCMPNPFTLRPDDLSALAQLYFIWQGQGASMPGKEDSLQRASTLDGYLWFPNGQGMDNVNVTIRRHAAYTAGPEDWDEVSAVSGSVWRQINGTPIAGLDGSPAQSVGWTDARFQGYWKATRIPIDDGVDWQSLVMKTEPINPLYMGPYALIDQPSGSTTMAPSGSSMQMESDIANRYYDMRYEMTANDAVSTCNTGADGTEGAPAAVNASGWWSGTICGWGHNAWFGMTMKANRTAVVEVTALDETGSASATKLMPVVGVWRATDGLGQAPTVTASPVSFNTGVVGMTSVRLDGSAVGGLRLVVADQRGSGRPDFAYQGRIFYGDSVQPANVSAAGGTVVISGMGFRAGNQVFVNGVQATVTAVTGSSMTVVVPSLQALGLTRATLATVVVRDVTTGATSTMTQALGYGSPGERLQVISVPAGSLAKGVVAATTWAVRVLGNDGVTPVAGERITFAVTQGTAALGLCGGMTCAVVTDANGMAQTTVLPTALGTLWMKASTSLLSSTTAATVVAPDVMTLVSAPAGTGTVGSATTAAFAVRVMAADGVTPRAGQTVTLLAENGTARLEACGAASCSLKTDATGVVQTAVTPLVAGRVVLDANAAAGSLSVNFLAATETMSLVSAPSAPVLLGTAAGTAFAVRVVGGDGSTPVPGEAVVFSAVGGGVRFGACGGATCTVLTDASGVARSAVTATAGGAVVLTAAAASGAVTSRFVAGVRSMVPVNLPSGTVPVGSPVTMSVRLLTEDGVTPVVGEPVQFSATGGALLGACGAMSCAVVSDAAGLATTTVTPMSGGAITVTATATEGSQTASLTGQQQPDQLQVVAQVSGPVYVGEPAGTPITVRLVLADGVTPVAGQMVTFAAANGAALWSGCGAASCVVTTDAHGLASATVTAASPGSLQVLVTAPAATLATPVSLSLTAVARVRSVLAATTTMYVAEGTAASWPVNVSVSDNALQVEGVAVQWTGGAGLSFAQATTAVAGGTTQTSAQVAGLGAGVSVRGTACAWATVCAPVIAVGVGAGSWQVDVVAGGGQVLSGPSGAQPMAVRVTDGQGHPVLGVPISVQQTVTAWQQACPDLGRCTNPPVLRTSTTLVFSDGAGMATVLPTTLQAGEVLRLLVSTGTQGQTTATLERMP